MNNERYGDKRLTPLFRDYVKEPGSLAADYMEYYAKVDIGSIDILNSDLLNNPEYQNGTEEQRQVIKDNYDETLIKDMLFYMFNDRGDLINIGVSLINPDFIILSNVDGQYDSSYEKMKQILNKINLGGFVINFEC